MSEDELSARRKKRKRVTKIFVCSKGEKHGPFSRQEVSRQLVDGVFKLTDLGWFNRLNQWVPLEQIASASSSEEGPLYPMPAVPRGVVEAALADQAVTQTERRRRSSQAKGWLRRLLGR